MIGKVYECIDKLEIFFSLLGCNPIVSQERPVPSIYAIFNITTTIPSPGPRRAVRHNPVLAPRNVSLARDPHV